MNSELENLLAKKKNEARKKLLNRFDVLSFDKVPQYIVEAFFGVGCYKERMIVTVFGYVNGLSIDQIFSLIRWKNFTDKKKMKMIALFNLYLPLQRYQVKYYSYCVRRGAQVFCDGTLRINGNRLNR